MSRRSGEVASSRSGEVSNNNGVMSLASKESGRGFVAAATATAACWGLGVALRSEAACWLGCISTVADSGPLPVRSVLARLDALMIQTAGLVGGRPTLSAATAAATFSETVEALI